MKVNTRIAVLALTSVLTLSTLTTSCSKDNNEMEEPQKGTIDPAVGTYKGKLSITPSNPDDTYEWYDAIVMVTKEGSNKLKVTAKSGQAYSNVTPKIFTVETGAFFGENTQDIVTLSGSIEGFFHYYGSNKNISVMTKKQSSTEIDFDFDGVKQ